MTTKPPRIPIPDIPMPAVVQKALHGAVAPKAYAAARYYWAYIFCPLCGHSRLTHNQMPKGRSWLSLEQVQGQTRLNPKGWGECTKGTTTWCYACQLTERQRESGRDTGAKLPDRKPGTATGIEQSGRGAG